MARQRLGVVLLVPQPVATEIEGLRRALGASIGRIPPHITLVPPVNVQERELGDAFRAVRAAASACAPLHLELGPVRTFAPVNPVAYLAVGGEEQVLDALTRLHASCLSGPLQRELEHDFVPHVTIADELAETRLDAVVPTLRDFATSVTVDRVHVLAEQPGRMWTPIADAPLGDPVAVVGRGSLPLELTTTGRPDVEAAALLSFEEATEGRPFAVTARRDGQVVGAVWGWTNGGTMELADLVVVAEHRGQGIGRHLLNGAEALGRRRSCAAVGAWVPVAGAAASLFVSAGYLAVVAADAGAHRRWHRQLSGPQDDAG
jgi:2'-5' RNA ligase/GNAT superfamily N-acetyltransferase